MSRLAAIGARKRALQAQRAALLADVRERQAQAAGQFATLLIALSAARLARRFLGRLARGRD
jgi:hypothetical protein